MLPLTATMVLWMNLVTDAAPALAIGLDPPDRMHMMRPPRGAAEPVITARMWAGIALAGAVTAAGTLGVLDAGLPGGLIEGAGDVAHARTLAFHTLVLFSLVGVFSARSDTAPLTRALFANRWLWAALALALALQALVLYVPALQLAFSTVPLSARDWLVAVAVAATSVVARELQKAGFRAADARRARRAG